MTAASRGTQRPAADETAAAEFGPVTAVRGLVYVSALRLLRARGLERQLLAKLPPAERAALPLLAVSDWVPVSELGGVFHACEALDWTVEQQIDFGADITRTNNGVTVNTLVRLAGKAGFSPWHVIGAAPKLWPRNYQGGGIDARQQSAKRAEVTVHAAPFAELSSFRNTMIGAYVGLIAMFSRPPVVTELAARRTASSFTLSVGW